MTTSAIRVVLVDDHRMLSELLAGALSENDDVVVVGVANSGSEALPMVSALRPDVVVLDYDLPDADGVSLVGPLLDAAPACRVLMLTSFTDPVVLSDAIDAGCAGFVTKRNSTDEIVSAVRAAHFDETPVSPDMVRSLVGRGRPTLGSDLTAREIEVLRHAAQGLSNKEIAEQLYLSVNTVRNHMQHVLNKLGAHSKLEATAIGVRLGIVRR
ncbi:response regulator transcription factor [Ilumatobacter nonamiensis]|uniref:response regulator transcription factor n=1 Tax=Ilumatobacter nonamiensis TaxID=467093 RepID=UPI00034CBAEB|nr:response regulator transcription factor [Ilumatobacter nonamiensis]